ncbi:MAG: TolC family protein [Gemmatimonadales bacterium]
MKRTPLIGLLAVALSAPVALVAQNRSLPSVPQSLSLRDAVELATRYNPVHRQVENDRPGAAWGVRNAYASFIPRVDLSSSASYTGAGTQNFFGSTSFLQPSATIGSSYRLGLSMNLDGQTIMGPGLAKAQLKAAEAAITSSEINLEASVRQQYLTVLEAEAQVELSRKQVERNEEFLRLARSRYEVGQNTMLDVRQAEVSLGQSRVTLLQGEQSVIVEKLRLFQQMGVQAPTDPSVVTLSDSFPIVAPEWKLEDLLADADINNPDLLQLTAQKDAASANERAVKAQWLPSLSLNAGWSGFARQFTDDVPLVEGGVMNARNSAQQQLDECNFQNAIIAGLATPTVAPLDCSGFSFTPTDEAALRARLRDQNNVFPFGFTAQPFNASVTISLPIFTQFSRPLRNSQAAAQAEDAREAVRARELDVRTAVTQAYYGLQTAYETIAIQEQNRIAADEGLRLARERYRVGSGTFFELLDAQLAAEQAERDYINAVYGYHRAISTLEAAVGRPLR